MRESHAPQFRIPNSEFLSRHVIVACTVGDRDRGPVRIAIRNGGVGMKALWVALLAATCATSAFGQGRGAATQPPPATQPPATQPATQPPRPRPVPRPVAPRVVVRDQSGTGVPGVKLTIT